MQDYIQYINKFSSLEQSIDSLAQILKEQIGKVYGQETLKSFNNLISDCREGQNLDVARGELKRLNLEQLKKITHSFTVFFLLSNQAEQCEIIKIKQQRQLSETALQPRAESIAEALRELKNNGLSATEVADLISKIKLTPTLTAHPTESRRRSILKKQLSIADALFCLSDKDVPELKKYKVLQQVEALIASLLLTDDVRANRLSVQDEVENGLFFLSGSIVELAPELNQDFRSAFRVYFGQELPAFSALSYRSWIGGDRDGNPKVTCSATRSALWLHKQEGLRYYLRQIAVLRDELSISTRKIGLSSEINKGIQKDRLSLGLAAEELVDPHQVYEPLREKCECIKLKLTKALEHRFSYSIKSFLEDLNQINDVLREANLSGLATSGILQKIIDQAQSFGFYLAKLDLRQHSDVHQSCLNEILKINSIVADYSALDESEKIELLQQLLSKDNKLSCRSLSEASTEVLEVFSLIAELQNAEDDGFGAYIISMTHSVSDMLEPLVLWHIATSAGSFPLDLSPLFETIDDLENCGTLLRSIFENVYYKKHLSGRNHFQEVMLGYSDSNKDGGYASANILLYEAQLQISRASLDSKIDFQIFHGRGGSVGRGGGRAGRAILASPGESHNGKVRLTEQGEVISFRYSMKEIGHRHLEQILSAILLATQKKADSLSADELKILKQLAKESMLQYRNLIDSPGFWEWYVAITPIKYISSLPIASRPVMRSGSNLEFENLRAIPWVFSWTQTRYNIASWYGLGSAFKKLIQQGTLSLTDLSALYTKRTFVKTLIDNAQQEMARARMQIAQIYAARSKNSFHEQILTEFVETENFILKITGQNALLDNNPVIQKSICRRNPLTDPLSLIQIELLDRAESGAEDLTEAMHMTISGLAAAMQTTG